MRQGTRLVAGVLAAAAAGGAVVALGVALLLANTVSLRSTADRTLRTGAYLTATINLEGLVLDAETGLRGYVITGRSLFLAPERTAVAQLPSAGAALQRAAAADGGAFSAQAASLLDSVHAYLRSYVPQVLAQVSADPKAARSFATTVEGKHLVDGIRGQTSDLEQLISSQQAARQRAAHRSANTAVAVGVIVLVALTALTIALAGILGWLLIGRERARERTEALYRASEQTALTLQRSLLPTDLPDLPSCELAIRFAPAGAGELVGGDFYDVFAVGADRWAVVIGDVCGKGPQAAAVTAMARWTLRSFATAAAPPADVLRRLNDAMLRQRLEGRFITLAYALLDLRGDEARVTVACAGHPPAIVVSALGEPEPVEASGDLLGVWPDVRLRQAELELGPGEALVLYTDGVTDAGPTRPGVERSAEQLLRRPGSERSAEALADALLDEAEQPAGVARDDVAIVAVRYAPPEHVLDELRLTAGSAAA
ncbi:MAG TPA: SpoIIE family protein phosphatase [Solirubrobacteraceae bacterium]|nr:SpoIIE family protein phosphatase [Solirubrobacteraceae bacterium]